MKHWALFIIFLIIGWQIPFFFAGAQSLAGQAALFLSPAAGSFLVGSTFDVSVVLDTKGSATNLFEVELFFPPDKIQVASPSVSGRSVIEIWPTPPSFSNQEGRISFVGGIPSPGIVTSNGVILTLTFRVVAPGKGQISFGEGTKVRANDGKGTDILGQSPSAFFNFLIPPPLGPAVSSPTHPDQERWYRDNNPIFAWLGSNPRSVFSYSIDGDPAGFPDTAEENTGATASFQDLTDGIWYFHLREGIDDVWGGVSHYVVKIDNQSPAAFKVEVTPGKRTTDRKPVFRFFTTDAFSGIDHFEMKIVPLSYEIEAQGLFFQVVSPYQTNFKPCRYEVVIRALDRAGNSKSESVTLSIIKPIHRFVGPEGINLTFVFVPWDDVIMVLGLAFVIVVIILLVLWRRHQHHLGHAFREDVKKFLGFSRKVLRKEDQNEHQ